MAVTGVDRLATKKPRVATYVEPWVDRAIDEEAAKQRRSRSAMVALLLEEILSQKGYSEAGEQSAE
jgi:hypothetical protein